MSRLKLSYIIGESQNFQVDSMGLKNVSMIMILKPQSTHYGSKYQQFKCVYDTLPLDRPSYLYKLVEHRQTVQTKLRHRRTRCLIRSLLFDYRMLY